MRLHILSLLPEVVAQVHAPVYDYRNVRNTINCGVIFNYCSFNEDILRCCTSSSDTINASLVEGDHKNIGRFIMKLVVAIKYNVVVGLELGSYICSIGLEIRRRSKDAAIIAPEVVRVNNSMTNSCCNE